jgi:hypothetical protein
VAQARRLTESADQVARALALLPDLLTENARAVVLVFSARRSAWRQE